MFLGNVLTSSLSSTCIDSGRANPTWASSVMRTRYSELLNLGALSFLSISRMVNVVTTVAGDGVRSSFSSVAYTQKHNRVFFSMHKINTTCMRDISKGFLQRKSLTARKNVSRIHLASLQVSPPPLIIKISFTKM